MPEYQESISLLRGLLTENRVVRPDVPTGNVALITGPPGSGKSMVRKYGLIDLQNAKYVAVDTWIELLASEDELGNPEVIGGLHQKYADKFKKHSMDSIAGGRRDENYIIELTGGDFESLVGRVNTFKGHGFRVVLVHVEVPLHVALAGNKARPRRVPEQHIVKVFQTAKANFNEVLPMVDEAWVITNWTGEHYPNFKDYRSSDLIKRVK